MKYDANAAYADRLNAAYTAITNARNTEPLLETLTEWGYDKERLDQGMALYDAAQAIFQQHAVEFAEQLEATDAKHEKWQLASKPYMRYLKLARILFRDDRPARTALGLDGVRADDIAGWLSQAHVFYGNALKDESILETLATLNISRDKLSDGAALVDALEEAEALRLKETGDTQQATEERQEKFDQLDQWMSDFLNVATVVFEDEPQSLEALGITVA